jgi:hypothetical protein
MPRDKACQFCPDLAYGAENKWGMPKLEQLEHSAQKGCSVCLLLRDAILHCIPESDRTKNGYLYWIGELLQPRWCPNFTFDMSYADAIRLDFFTLPGKLFD